MDGPSVTGANRPAGVADELLRMGGSQASIHASRCRREAGDPEDPARPGVRRDRARPILREVVGGGEDAQPADERSHGLPDDGTEPPVEVVGREVGHPGEGVEREVPSEVVVGLGKHALDPALVLLPRDLVDLRRTTHL